MRLNNNDVSRMFSETADLLEIKGDNPFRIRAYRNAARTVENLTESVSDMIERGEKLSKLPGIGSDLEGKIKDIALTGKFEKLEELKRELPGDMSRMMNVAGLGPRRLKKINEELGVTTLDELEKTARDRRIRGLEGLGEKTEKAIIESIERLRETEGTFVIAQARESAEELIDYLKEGGGIKKIEVAGSLRRCRETVGDIDILVCAEEKNMLMRRFVGFERVNKVISKGETRSSVLLNSGMQVDLRVVAEESFGAALSYFTGSKEHNIQIRKRGLSRGLKINEYGVFKGDERVAGKSESSVYRRLGLDYIPPELRENRGEIEAAEKGNLPELLKTGDIRGDLHMHTNLTDGQNTLEEMVKGCRDRGYDYVAVSEHSRQVAIAGGIDEETLEKRIEEINRLNEEIEGIHILNSIEVDIMADGTLDLSDSVLEKLDLTVCSVHYKFNMTEKEMTKRIIKAMENRNFNILGHPTGRMLNDRQPYKVNMKEILKAAGDNNCFMELNAHPKRLDLNDIHLKMARDMGVKVAISTDAHSIKDLGYIKYGRDQAARGWLRAEDVINTYSLEKLMNILRKKR